MRLLSALLLALLLTGCATEQNRFDPLEPVNRSSYALTDILDKTIVEPVADGYIWLVPKSIRIVTSNFFDNIGYLNVVLNSLLQGKGKQGLSDAARFVINSTLGIAGLADVATPLGFEKHNEDFGQTLAVWGLSEGGYLFVPVLGPSSYRAAPGYATQYATSGLTYIANTMAQTVALPITALWLIDTRARLKDAGEMRDELALDPYLFTRDAYRQRVNYLVHDGNPPKAKEEESWDQDEWDK